MDAATRLKELMDEVERLRFENEILSKTIVQMKRSLDRLIIKYIEDGQQKA